MRPCMPFYARIPLFKPVLRAPPKRLPGPRKRASPAYGQSAPCRLAQVLPAFISPGLLAAKRMPCLAGRRMRAVCQTSRPGSARARANAARLPQNTAQRKLFGYKPCLLPQKCRAAKALFFAPKPRAKIEAMANLPNFAKAGRRNRLFSLSGSAFGERRPAFAALLRPRKGPPKPA